MEYTPNGALDQAIKAYLCRGNWEYGGTIGIDVGTRMKVKLSNVERRCRELAKGERGSGENLRKFKPVLEDRKVPNPAGKGSKVVQYRLKIDEQGVKEFVQRFRPEIQERMEKERTLQTLFQL